MKILKKKLSKSNTTNCEISILLKSEKSLSCWYTLTQDLQTTWNAKIHHHTTGIQLGLLTSCSFILANWQFYLSTNIEMTVYNIYQIRWWIQVDKLWTHGRPTLGPIFFIFMWSFLTNRLEPRSGKSWIRHCLLYTPLEHQIRLVYAINSRSNMILYSHCCVHR